MKAYTYDRQGYFVGSIEVKKSPKGEKDVYLLPRNATLDVPMQPANGMTPRFVDEVWVLEQKPSPEPPAPIDLLGKTDMELVKLVARQLEDILTERKAEGKFVPQDVQDKIAERQALRAQI